MPVTRFRFRRIDARPLLTRTSLAPSGEQPYAAISAAVSVEWPCSGAARTPHVWMKSAYAAARILTQLGILAMAAMSASPVLIPLVIRLGSGASTYRLQIPAMLVLSCLTLASFALTSALRNRLHADPELARSAR